MNEPRTAIPFIGRDRELQLLRAALSRAAESGPEIVVLEGDAGIGKTRLISELLVESQPVGTVVVGAAAPHIEAEIPYAPFVDAFRDLPSDDVRRVKALLGPSAAHLGAIAPAFADWSTDAPTVSGRTQLFEALLSFFSRLGSPERPAVVVLEDLHWADASSRDALAYVVRNLRNAPLLIVATHRGEQRDPGDPFRRLLAELDRSERVTRIVLPPLDVEQARALIAATGDRPTSRRTEALWSRSGGNPLFLRELALAGGTEVPATLRELLLARVAALPDDARLVVRVAATCGPFVPGDVIGRVLGGSPPAVIEATRRAVNDGVLEPVVRAGRDGYRFRQRLLGEVVYADLLADERRHLHAAVALALEAQPATGRDPERTIAIGLHWAEAGEAAHAAPALAEAAEAALQIYAFPEADDLFERSLAFDRRDSPAADRARIGFQMAAPSEDKTERWRLAAEAASLAGRPERALARIDEALAAEAHGPRRPIMLTQRGRYQWQSGDSAGALESHEAAVAALATIPTADAVRVETAAARALLLAGRFEDAVDRARQAVARGTAENSTADTASALTVLAAAAAHLGAVDESMAALDAARRADEARRAESRLRPRPSRIADMLGDYLGATQALERAGRHEEAAALAGEGASIASRVGAERSWGRVLNSAAAAELFRLGRWQEADDVARALLESAEAPTREAVEAIVVLIRIAAARGDEASVADLGRLADARRPASVPPAVDAALLVARADSALWAGRPHEAGELLRAALATLGAAADISALAEIAALGLRASADRAERDRARGSTAEVAAALEETAVFGGVAQAVRSRSGRQAGGRAAAWLALADAEARRAQDTGDAGGFAEASRTFEAVHERLLTGYADWRAAEALLSEPGDRQRAASLLTAAAATARDLGAGPLRDEVERLARRARLNIAADEPPARPTAPDLARSRLGLSEREFEVLQLLADGLTNRQIADRLFITEKTAGHHVSSILTKVGAANRLEAAMMASRAGLIGPDDRRP